MKQYLYLSFLLIFMLMACKEGKEEKLYPIHRVDLEVFDSYQNLKKLSASVCDTSIITYEYSKLRDSVIQVIDLLIVEMIDASGGFSEEGADHLINHGYLDYRLIKNPKDKSSVKEILFENGGLLTINNLLMLFRKETPSKFDLEKRIVKKYGLTSSSNINESLSYTMKGKSVSEAIFLFHALINIIISIESEYIYEKCLNPR